MRFGSKGTDVSSNTFHSERTGKAVAFHQRNEVPCDAGGHVCQLLTKNTYNQNTGPT